MKTPWVGKGRVLLLWSGNYNVVTNNTWDTLLQSLCYTYYYQYFMHIFMQLTYLLTLLHKSSNSKPETVEYGELVFNYVCVWVTWMGVAPFIRGEAGYHKQHEADTQYPGYHVDPHVQVQRGQEGEQFGRFWFGFLVQNGNTKVQKWFGEIHPFLSVVCYSHSGHCDISFLNYKYMS